MTPFVYHKPVNVDEGLARLKASSDGAWLAGGMTLLPTLKQRLREVTDLVDLCALHDLTNIQLGANAVTIGAMATHAMIAGHPDMFPALASLAAGIGDPQVRNRGTIGGSLANNDPSADWPAAVLACNATVVTSAGSFAADEFFTGMFSTALSEGALITAVHFEKPARAAYVKFRHPASGYAMAGVFVAVMETGVRVAITGATACIKRWPAAELALTKTFTNESLAGLAFESEDMLGDIHASAAYRAHLANVMLGRAVAKAMV